MYKLLILFGLAWFLSEQSVSAEPLLVETVSSAIFDPNQRPHFTVSSSDLRDQHLALTVWNRMTNTVALQLPESDFNVALSLRAEGVGDLVLPAMPKGAYELKLQGKPSAANCYFAVVSDTSIPEDRHAIPFFGMNDHLYSLNEFSAYRRFGIYWKRDLITRAQAEPARGKLDGGTLQTRLSWLKSLHERGSLIVAYNPKWDLKIHDIGEHHSPPSDSTDYLNYVGAVSSQMDRRLVPVLEIWNEPNINFFEAPAELYSNLLKSAYIRAKQQDPDRVVHMAGLSGFDWAFLDRLRESGALNYTDALVLHPYFWSDPDEILERNLKRLREWHQKYAPRLPIYCNEWGFAAENSHPDAIKKQAEFLMRETMLLWAFGIDQSCCYQWSGDAYRLSEPNGAARPAALALRTCAQYLTNAEFVGRLEASDTDIHAYVFKRDGVTSLMTWCSKANRSLRSELFGGSAKYIVDAMGNESSLTGPQPALNLSSSPVFLIGIDPKTAIGLDGALEAQKASTPALLLETWVDFQYPSGSRVFSLVRGQKNLLRFTVHNQSSLVQRMLFELSSQTGVEIEPTKIERAIAPDSTTTLEYFVNAEPSSAKEEFLATLSARGAGYSLPDTTVHLFPTAGFCFDFLANTFEERSQTIENVQVKRSSGAVWTSSTGHVTWKFDLTLYKTAQVQAYFAGSASGEKFAFSNDDRSWTVNEGKKASGCLEWNCDQFAGGVLYLKFASGDSAPAATVNRIHLNAGKM